MASPYDKMFDHYLARESVDQATHAKLKKMRKLSRA